MVQALLWRRRRQHRRGGHGWTGERRRDEECVRGRVQSRHLPLSTTSHGTRPRIPACLLPPQRRHRRIQFPPASIYARRRRRISCPRPQSRRKPLPAATTHAPAHPGTYAQVPCTCPLHALTGPADRSGSPSPCPAGHRAAAAIHPHQSLSGSLPRVRCRAGHRAHPNFCSHYSHLSQLGPVSRVRPIQARLNWTYRAASP